MCSLTSLKTNSKQRTMTIPKDFDDIRPFTPEEMQGAFDKLSDDKQFQAVVAKVFPGIPFEAIMHKARQCKTMLDFQKAFSYGIMQSIIDKHTDGTDVDFGTLDKTKNYTFLSNHRDIVLDSGFLSKLMLDNGFGNTVEIAIGNNLLVYPWINYLVRLNKSFIVKRNLHGRQKLLASQQLSGYMHFAIKEKKESIWIAQRQGRSKDSDDRTQSSILKMMRLGGTGTIIERLQQLNIVPLSISYEYDPCDYLKAKEFQQRRDNPEFQKSMQDDLESMSTGIFGYKGHVHYQAAACMNEWLGSLDGKQHKTELYPIISEHIDHEIHSHYRLYANNYIAYDHLNGNSRFANLYTKDEEDRFENYLKQQIGKINLPDPDLDYLECCMLTMYSNPLKNYLAAAEAKQS